MADDGKSIWETQYGTVADWDKDSNESMRKMFRRAVVEKPEPPQPSLFCTSDQWDEAVAYRDLTPEEKATADVPIVAMLLGWGPNPWSEIDQKQEEGR